MEVFERNAPHEIAGLKREIEQLIGILFAFALKVVCFVGIIILSSSSFVLAYHRDRESVYFFIEYSNSIS